MIYVNLTEKACVNIFEACTEKINWDLQNFCVNIMFLYDRVSDQTLKDLGDYILDEFKKHRDHGDVELIFCGTNVRGFPTIEFQFGEKVTCPLFALLVEDERTKDVCLSNHGHPADLTMLIH